MCRAASRLVWRLRLAVGVAAASRCCVVRRLAVGVAAASRCRVVRRPAVGALCPLYIIIIYCRSLSDGETPSQAVNGEDTVATSAHRATPRGARHISNRTQAPVVARRVRYDAPFL